MVARCTRISSCYITHNQKPSMSTATYFSCPKCGHQVAQEGHPHLFTPLSLVQRSEGEQTILSQEISRLESTVRTLSEKLVVLRTRLNEIRSTTTVFPPEVLSTVFRFVCLSNKSNSPEAHEDERIYLYPVFSLCSVSSYWRRLAISTPELWTVLDLTHKRRTPSPPKSLALLHVYAARSSGQFLCIKIDTTMKRKREPSHLHPIHAPINLTELEHGVFVQYPSKVQKLTLFSTLGKWVFLVQLLGPQLTKLRVGLVDWWEPDCPPLKLVDCRWTTSLTVLELYGAPITDCVQLLMHCPSLIEYRACRPITVQLTPENQIPPNHTVTLEHLKWFEWTTTQVYWDAAILKHIHLPSLQRLDWVEHGPDSLPPYLGMTSHFSRAQFYTYLTQFLSFPSSTLTNLQIDLADITNEDVLYFAPTITVSAPNLRKLTIRCIRGFYNTIPSTIVPLLRPLLADGGDLVVPLPALEHLFFKTRSGILVGTPSIQENNHGPESVLLFDIIKQRRDLLHISSFRLEFDMVDEWSPGVIQGFRELIKEGLKLEVFVASRPVGWLHQDSPPVYLSGSVQ
ncbi:hypothetical protein P691DRAFT_217122 [Macrolepiota fuliginosa MF-IS2]|uniref:F-box domain-containing protein n=1 Tax=Macrolepiota fuliginosa MF-IS2 TaxID=1400762 RepID=A0A9P5X841_9AGAR|nr:hypothetical protein P691DRAFT_217122 [Macrolepiota fuliginosa MF-IS2]